MSNIIVQATNLSSIYSTIRKGSKKRFDVILEPFQAVLQLALLSQAPVGTKISIKDNCVELQYPTYSQGLLRWYNNDNKDDLIYLFQVCRRFPMFYQKLRRENNEFYTLLIIMAQRGIAQLIKTYQDKERLVLLHILQLFKSLLEKDEEELNGIDTVSGYDSDGSFQTCCDETLDEINLGNKKDKNENVMDDKEDVNIEGLFKKISEIYTDEHYSIVYNTLILLGNTEDENMKDTIVSGLNLMMIPAFSRIKPWITENVLF